MDIEATLPVSATSSVDWSGWRNLRVKIVDLGNACWVYHHFTDDVQTRQYRAPEVIIGAPWGPPVDVWSVACIVFELLTCEFLFEPHSGPRYDKDDDHLAQILELLGSAPKNAVLSGKFSNEFFNRNGELRRIKRLKHWGLEQVLVQKYKLSSDSAKLVTSFMLPMLEFKPQKRTPAEQALQHPWIKETVQELSRAEGVEGVEGADQSRK